MTKSTIECEILDDLAILVEAVLSVECVDDETTGRLWGLARLIGQRHGIPCEWPTFEKVQQTPKQETR